MYIFAYFKYYEFLRCCSNAYILFFLDSVRLNVDKTKKRRPVGFRQIQLFSEAYQSICYGNVLFGVMRAK